jgi:hypothetical protein
MSRFLDHFLKHPAGQDDPDFRQALLTEFAGHPDPARWLATALKGGFSMAGEQAGWDGNALTLLSRSPHWTSTRWTDEGHSQQLALAGIALIDAGCPVELDRMVTFVYHQLCFAGESEEVGQLAELLLLAFLASLPPADVESEGMNLVCRGLRDGSLCVPMAVLKAGFSVSPLGSHELIGALGDCLWLGARREGHTAEQVDLFVSLLCQHGLDLVRAQDEEGGIAYLIGRSVLATDPAQDNTLVMLLAVFEQHLALARGRQMEGVLPPGSPAKPAGRL